VLLLPALNSIIRDSGDQKYKKWNIDVVFGIWLFGDAGTRQFAFLSNVKHSGYEGVKFTTMLNI
jgi:hypothetical protein